MWFFYLQMVWIAPLVAGVADPGSHYLVFQNPSDILGVATGFGLGDGLPSGNFTIAMTQKFNGIRGTRCALIQFNWDLVFFASTVDDGRNWGLFAERYWKLSLEF